MGTDEEAQAPATAPVVAEAALALVEVPGEKVCAATKACQEQAHGG